MKKIKKKRKIIKNDFCNLRAWLHYKRIELKCRNDPMINDDRELYNDIGKALDLIDKQKIMIERFKKKPVIQKKELDNLLLTLPIDDSIELGYIKVVGHNKNDEPLYELTKLEKLILSNKKTG